MKFSEKDKPTISGHLTFELDAKDGRTEEFERILDLIKEEVKFRWKKTGSYVFSGGIVSNFNLIENNNGLFTASLRFLRAKPFFLDNLMGAVFPKSMMHTISCSIKGELDFDRIKAHLKDSCEWFRESKESFSAEKRSKEQDIRVTVYPRMTVMNLICEFKGEDEYRSLPGEIVRNLCKIGGGAI